MPTSISSVAQTQSNVTTAVQGPKPAAKVTGSPANTANAKIAAPKGDSVQLSSAAQAAIAALKEAFETTAQTTKEASGGDRSAQRLLVKEAASRSATQ